MIGNLKISLTRKRMNLFVCDTLGVLKICCCFFILSSHFIDLFYSYERYGDSLHRRINVCIIKATRKLRKLLFYLMVSNFRKTRRNNRPGRNEIKEGGALLSSWADICVVARINKNFYIISRVKISNLSPRRFSTESCVSLNVAES